MKVYVVKKPGRKYLVHRWMDPVTGVWKERSSKTANRRDAQRGAANLELELQTEGHIADDRIIWPVFVDRYEAEHLANLSESARYLFNGMAGHLRAYLDQRYETIRLTALNASVISGFGAFLRSRVKSNETAVSYLKGLRAALGWAKNVGLLGIRPRINLGRKSKHRSNRVRCSPLNDLQYAAILAAIPAVCPRDFPDWEMLLQGLWHSGLRIGEAAILSWNPDDIFSVDLSGEFPRYRILSESEKGREDRFLPIVPEWGELLLRVPAEARRGRVFVLAKQWQPNWLQKILRRICGPDGAAVETNSRLGKFASAHDFRATFGSRWARRVAPAVLQQLMRHKSIDTTMDHYVDLNADDLGRDLWSKHNATPN